jgi:hypothetical protein
MSGHSPNLYKRQNSNGVEVFFYFFAEMVNIQQARSFFFLNKQELRKARSSLLFGVTALPFLFSGVGNPWHT